MNQDQNTVNPIAECFAKIKTLQAEARQSGTASVLTRIYYEQVSKLFASLRLLSSQDIQSVISGLNSSQTGFLRGISTSGAIWAVRNVDCKWLVLGLRGLLLENQTNDPRETKTKMVLLEHSAKKIGCSFAAIVDEVLRDSQSDVPLVVRHYLSEPVESLESVGYREATDDTGQFCYDHVS